MLVSLGTVNLSTPNNRPESQNNFQSLKYNAVNNNLNNNSNMPVPPEDANSDGIVDSDDLAIAIVESNNFCSENCLADVDGNGFTDLTDVVLIFEYIETHLNQ